MGFLGVLLAGWVSAVAGRLLRLRAQARWAWADFRVQAAWRRDLARRFTHLAAARVAQAPPELAGVNEACDRAAAAAGPPEAEAANRELTAAIAGLVRHPSLAEDPSLQEAGRLLARSEETLRDVTRYHDAAGADYNAALRTWPGHLIGALCGWPPMAVFRPEASGTGAPAHPPLSP